MNKKFTSTALAALMIAGTTSFSAFAAMPEGTVVIGATAYDLDYANSHISEITAAIVAGGDVYVKGFTGNWINNATGLTVAANIIPAVVYKDANGVVTNYNAADMDVVVNTELKVASVSAINATQLKVTFTQAVDKTSAETVANYALSLAGTVTPVLQADGMSVILNLGTPINVNTSVSFTATVKGIIEASNSAVLSPLYTQVVTTFDTTAPSVASVTSSTKGAIATAAKITFSEPLASTPALKIDGVTISSGIAATTDSKTGVTVINLTGLSLDATTTHSLQVVNATDNATNVNSVSNTSFSITTDTVAPQVASIAQYSDDTLIVKFNKDINPATVASNIVVADGSLNNVAVNGIVADPVDARTFEVKLTGGSFYSTKTSNNLTVLFKAGILDTVGNALTAATKSITLNQDTVAPNVTGVAVNKNAAGDTTGITVSFDSKVDNAFTPDLSKITAVNSNGIIDSTTFSTLAVKPVVYGDTSVTLNFASPKTLAGKYGFTFAKTFAKDLSIAENASNAYSQTIDFGTAASTSTWALATTQTLINAAITTPAADKIVVTFPGAVKGGAVAGSATDPSNYTLNGSTLPAGTVITLGVGQTVATIVLPAGSVAASDSSAVFTMRNIQRTSDSLPIAVTTATISATDNTAPTLLSAKVLDNKHIVLTYSEAMAPTFVGNVGTEFQIAQGGNAITFADADLSAARLSGYTNQVTLTMDQGADAAATLGTAEVNTLGITTGAVTAAGNIAVTFSDGTINKTISVPVLMSDSATVVAGKIQVAMAADSTIAAAYNVSTATTSVIFTAKTAVADKSVTISVADATPTGVGTPSSSQTTPGVAPTAATSKTVLDLNQVLTLKALAPTIGIDMKDVAGVQQAASASSITITK